MKKSQQIDTAFKEIKTETGVTDVEALVKRFLTREQTYTQLLLNVSDSERKTETLKRDNEVLAHRLHDLKIDARGTSTEGNQQDLFADDEEIVEMREKIANMKRDMGIL